MYYAPHVMGFLCMCRVSSSWANACARRPPRVKNNMQAQDVTEHVTVNLKMDIIISYIYVAVSEQQ